MMRASKLLLCLLGFAAAVFAGAESAKEPVKIAAFNIQVFGTSKASEAETMDVLVRIVQRYDIILIQEIRDSSETAIYKLLWQIQTKNMEFDMVISERLGSTNTKEQYAYIFRKDKGIKVKDTYQYPERRKYARSRTFERPPFCVKFFIPNAVVQDVVMVGIHTDPDKAEEEINALVYVHDDVKSKWNVENVLLMGDFNAGCSYVSKKKLKKLDLREEGYHWLIPDDADTTVAASDCAYDRFVVSGEQLFDTVSPGSVKVFKYDSAYKLDNSQAKDISDHYPIEMALKGRGGSYQHKDGPACEASAANKIKSFLSSSWEMLCNSGGLRYSQYFISVCKILVG